LKLRSVNNIVIPPARTGRANTNIVAVANKDHKYKDSLSKVIALERQINIVTIKLIEDKIEEAPATCKDKIPKSIDILLLKSRKVKGGYTVQPLPTPSRKIETATKTRANKINQKERLFNRGKAISFTPHNKGISQFPKPPIRTGITNQKIITRPCPVITTLYK
jgi:hypothetical protein